MTPRYASRCAQKRPMTMAIRLCSRCIPILWSPLCRSRSAALRLRNGRQEANQRQRKGKSDLEVGSPNPRTKSSKRTSMMTRLKSNSSILSTWSRRWCRPSARASLKRLKDATMIASINTNHLRDPKAQGEPMWFLMQLRISSSCY